MAEYLIQDSSLTSVANAIRSKTGASGSLSFPNGFVDAIAGITSGNGGGNSVPVIGDETSLQSFGGMLYAITTGAVKHGEFTLTTALPNTETLVVSTGLSKVNGIMFAAKEFPDVTHASTSNQTGGFYIWFPGAGEKANAFILQRAGTTSTNNYTSGQGRDETKVLLHSTSRLDGGDLYVTAAYNANANYTPFAPGITYIWVAW